MALVRAPGLEAVRLGDIRRDEDGKWYPTHEQMELLTYHALNRLPRRHYDTIVGVLHGAGGIALTASRLVGHDYATSVQYTSYGDGENPGELVMLSRPDPDVIDGLSVLAMDDIGDSCKTLKALRAYLLSIGAKDVTTVTPLLKSANFDGERGEMPDYFELDVVKAWVNLPGDRGQWDENFRLQPLEPAVAVAAVGQ